MNHRLMVVLPGSVGGAADPGNPSNPGVLTDLFCRVGGLALTVKCLQM